MTWSPSASSTTLHSPPIRCIFQNTSIIFTGAPAVTFELIIIFFSLFYFVFSLYWNCYVFLSLSFSLALTIQRLWVSKLVRLQYDILTVLNFSNTLNLVPWIGAQPYIQMLARQFSNMIMYFRVVEKMPNKHFNAMLITNSGDNV